MSSKETKRKALLALKNARREGASGLDAVADFDEDDVYERMDEEEYRDYVEAKRDREDFVVDDDGLGYHDDGDYDIVNAAAEEYKLDNPNAAVPGTKKKTSNALTKDAVRKARRNKAGAMAAGGDGGTGKNGSMWNFVNQGTSAAAPSESKGNKGRDAATNEALAHDCDNLLDGLDDAPASSSSRRRSSGGRRSSAGSARRRSGERARQSVGSARKRRAHGSPTRSSRGPSRRATSSGRSHHRERESAREYAREEPDDYAENDADFGGDGQDVDFGNNDEGDVFGNHADADDHVEEKAEDEAEAEAEDEEDAVMENADANSDKNEASDVAEESAKEAVPAKSRARPGRLAGRLSALAEKRAAKEAEEERKLAEEKKLAMHKTEAERKAKEAALAKRNVSGSNNNKNTNNSNHKPGEILLDTTSTSFQPSSIAAAGTTHEAGVGGGMNLDRIVQVEEPSTHAMEVEGEEGKEKEEGLEPRPYLDMYWLDASERNGVVSLYGKVKVPTEHKKKGKGGDNVVYQSCCVTIPHNERNLFVLPRLLSKSTSSNGDEEQSESQQERAPIGDVYGELKSILQPSCIPHVQGANWKAKPVTRSYAFEDPSIPRGECQYIKVVYDGKYPVPDRNVCMSGGKTFDKILGAGASNLENFLIKRRLMGPGWVRIYGPKPLAGGNVSWCKWECTVDGPKSIKRLDLVTTLSGEKVTSPPPPPVSTVSIKFKTVVNPKSHKLEIVCVSAINHSNVLLDSASDESTKHMNQLTLVRPLNFDTNGAMAQFPRDMEKEIKNNMPTLQKSPNERALLSRLFAQLGNWDPDVLVSHNGWGHDIDVLLNRCVELKVSMWSKLGRRRQMKLPKSSHFGNGNDWAIAQALDGRVLCDTCLSAKEFLGRETTYSLTNLTKTQLKEERLEIEPVDVPQWCKTGGHFVDLAKHTLRDAQLVQCLMFKLQVLPLTKQLTNIAGNLWCRTMKGNRAERNEYLLLHEFHQLKYLVPEKISNKQRKEDQEEGGATAGSNNKAKYSGGLVLEPKKGLYDSFILLLDFNSLYPSLIQEYNLCFTTMEWSKANSPKSDEGGAPQGDVLPPLPDESLDRGVLPRVIKTLVDRRRNVKKMMKSEKDSDKKEELNLRQLALKLTANSMYGCLGFSHSRFYAQPIAALVTAMGRETLQRTVDLAQTAIGLEVIYGDTDSIMINTRITDLKEYSKVLELGNKVKREVNRLYKTLELEIDGVFRSMLLLKKKKYAAVTITQGHDGKFIMDKEMKGLDLVRRDWCIQSKDSGRYVLDQILSGEEKESVVNNIHEHLEKVATQMRSGELAQDKYVITKGLNKHPNDYPDARTLPHVFVAKRMMSEHKAVSIGDHIPYIICEEEKKEEDGQQQQQQASAKKSLAAERARHPDEIARSNGALKPDVEWYLTQQILPPISRLCEPIEGTSPGILAEKLGLDFSKYNSVAVNINEDDIVDFVPASSLSDDERFKDVEKFALTCSSCDESSEFPGVFTFTKDAGMTFCQSGLRCPNPNCAHADHWGDADVWSCVAKILNQLNLIKKQHQKRYYDGLTRCDDPMCGLETRQLSVYEGCCLKQGCNGRMKSVYTEGMLQTQLKYFDSLFDIGHACKQLEKNPQQAGSFTEKEIVKSLAAEDKEAFRLLHGFSSHSLDKSGYNWVSGNFFQNLFVRA